MYGTGLIDWFRGLNFGYRWDILFFVEAGYRRMCNESGYMTKNRILGPILRKWQPVSPPWWFGKVNCRISDKWGHNSSGNLMKMMLIARILRRTGFAGYPRGEENDILVRRFSKPTWLCSQAPLGQRCFCLFQLGRRTLPRQRTGIVKMIRNGNSYRIQNPYQRKRVEMFNSTEYLIKNSGNSISPQLHSNRVSSPVTVSPKGYTLRRRNSFTDLRALTSARMYVPTHAFYISDDGTVQRHPDSFISKTDGRKFHFVTFSVSVPRQQ